MLTQGPNLYPSESLVAAEIAGQPALWPSTLERMVAAGKGPALAQGPVVVTGAGSSAYAAMAVADAWPGARAIPTTDLLTQSAAEILAAVPSIALGGWLLSLARSGDSPESVGVVERLQRLFPRVKHLAIVCNPDGRLAHTPGVQTILLDAGTNDRSLAMTASFSNLVLAGLSLRHGREIGAALPAICSAVLRLLPEWNAAAETTAASCQDRVLLLASGLQPLVLEASIKVVELTAGRVIPMAESFLGVRHGPLTFARQNTPIICFVSSEARKRAYEKDLVEDLRARGYGKLVLVGGEEASRWPCDVFVTAAAPKLPTHLRTPFEIVFAQLLAFHLSLRVGVDPDNPSPDGVVTRVVRPFRVHDEVENQSA